MAVVEQVTLRAIIPSSQEIKELQNSVMKIEDLAERSEVATKKIKQSTLQRRGGIVPPGEVDPKFRNLTTAQGKQQTQTALGLLTNFQGTAATKLLGAANSILPVGFILSIATTVFGLIVAQFGAGGLFDRRKQELNSIKSLIGLERETDIIGGDTLFLGNPTLVQGIAKNQTSNTENLRDGQRRFVLRNNGY